MCVWLCESERERENGRGRERGGERERERVCVENTQFCGISPDESSKFRYQIDETSDSVVTMMVVEYRVEQGLNDEDLSNLRLCGPFFRLNVEFNRIKTLPREIREFVNLKTMLVPSTLTPQPSTLTPHPLTLTPHPSTLNPQSSTLKPHPSTLNP